LRSENRRVLRRSGPSGRDRQIRRRRGADAAELLVPRGRSADRVPRLRTSDPHRVVTGSDRAAPPDCRSVAEPGARASVALIGCFGFCCRAGGEVGAKEWQANESLRCVQKKPSPGVRLRNTSSGFATLLKERNATIGYRFAVTRWRSGVDSNLRCRAGFYGQKFGPSLARYSARRKATVPDRICSPLDSALLRLSPVRFVRQDGTPTLGDVEDQAKASGSDPRGNGAQADDGDMLACVFS
jgi:hypothetical protein